jgi:type IV pilus assembly protein PilC
LDASDAQLARARLRRQGIEVEQLQRQWWRRSERVNSRDSVALIRQWAVLLRAGVSLAPALQMLLRSTPQPALAARLEQVLTDVESGLPLSQALSRHPDTFGALHVSLVEAGENAGVLDTMMERLASTLEKNEALRARLRSALAYPCAVIAIALGVLALMLLYVVPVFAEVFEAFGSELPWSTQVVLTLSQALQHGASWALWLCVPGAMWLRSRWQRADWRRQWHRQVLDWPLVGPLVRDAAVARWAYTLSVLVQAGVPLTEALPVAGRASGHSIYERINEHLRRRVAQGGRLSDGMAHTGRFPPMLVQLCATAEESGTLGLLLGKAAELLSEELDARIRALSSLIEPLIIVVLGGAIGVILVAMYLPIFRLGQVF